MSDSEPQTAKAPQEDENTQVVPIAEEFVRIEKRQVTTGRIIVRTTVETDQHVVNQMLSQETVEVERIAINRVVDTVPQVRTEGEVTIIPVLEERLVVEKQLVLIEEVRIRRTVTVENFEVPVTLRKERATVERPDG